MHISVFAEMLCHAFAYDHQNYSRWGPVYIAEILLLTETAPEVTQSFKRESMQSKFRKYIFNTVWSDLGLEQSVVKDLKSRKGNIIGCSREDRDLKQQDPVKKTRRPSYSN